MTGKYYVQSTDADCLPPTFATPFRRRLLDVLRTADEPVDRTMVAESLVVADPELRLTADSLSDQIREVEIELHHHLLPKLDEVDVLAYDPADGRIEDVSLDDVET